MLDGIKAVEDKEYSPHIILSVVEGEFAGCNFYYDGIQIAEEENEDGTINMSFEYSITNDYVPEDKERFKNFLGDNIVSILTDAADKENIAYKGGT
jgi:hypothetical protein